jgi:hypothetical protein
MPYGDVGDGKNILSVTIAAQLGWSQEADESADYKDYHYPTGRCKYVLVDGDFPGYDAISVYSSGEWTEDSGIPALYNKFMFKGNLLKSARIVKLELPGFNYEFTTHYRLAGSSKVFELRYAKYLWSKRRTRLMLVEKHV